MFRRCGGTLAKTDIPHQIFIVCKLQARQQWLKFELIDPDPTQMPLLTVTLEFVDVEIELLEGLQRSLIDRDSAEPGWFARALTTRNHEGIDN